MLPKHHYSAVDSVVYNDSDWIAGQLDKLPVSMQNKVAKRYSDIYLQLTNEQDTKARFRANTWLRKVVDKHGIKQQEGYF